MGAGGTRRHALYLGRHAARGYYCGGSFSWGAGRARACVRRAAVVSLGRACPLISFGIGCAARGCNVILKSKIDSRPETRHFET